MIKLLLKSFYNLKQGENKLDVFIVPVCHSYDRLFDVKYLANEMINGQVDQVDSYAILRRIYNMRKGILGKVFIKYAEPINLSEYVKQHEKGNENISMSLTRDLYHIQ